MIDCRQELQEDFSERLHHLKKLFDISKELYEESIEVEGLLGEEAGLTEPLEDIYRELKNAFGAYEDFIQSLQSATYEQIELEKFYRSRKLVFSTGNDCLTDEVTDAVRDIRKKLKKYIK